MRVDNVEFIRVGAFAYQKPEPFPFCETLQTKSGELVTIRCKGILKPEWMGKIDIKIDEDLRLFLSITKYLNVTFGQKSSKPQEGPGTMRVHLLLFPGETWRSHKGMESGPG